VRGCPARRTGQAPLLQARPSTQRYGGDRRPAEAGQPDLAAAARPQGYRPKERDVAAALESDSSPTPPLWSWEWCPPQSRIQLDDFASPAWSRAAGPALGVPKARP